MPEAQIVLIYVLSVVLLMLVGGLAFYAMSSAKSRIIREQQRSLEAEQRLRRAQDAFTDNAHHELKTPLQILSGHLYMLRLHDPTPDQERLLSHAESATRRLQSLVQDLLDFSALQHGNLKIHFDLTDLQSYLNDLTTEYRALALTKGLAFHAELDPLPRAVVCDGPRLRRALAALLENAVRFTLTGSIQVRGAILREGGMCRLRFEVRDTGIGVPADWPRLLQPFEQEPASGNRVQEGMGLGLPLAAGILKTMGGQMGLVPGPLGTLAWAEVTLEEGHGPNPLGRAE
jgi:signal transduction histidine kinase